MLQVVGEPFADTSHLPSRRGFRGNAAGKGWTARSRLYEVNKSEVYSESSTTRLDLAVRAFHRLKASNGHFHNHL